MIQISKTISDNPFVDNLMYYCKYIALNCNIKDEKEALANETPESLYAGDVYIACIEGNANYEMFNSIPVEILEKYIEPKSNLDVLVSNAAALKTHLNSLGVYEMNRIYNNIESLARTVYIDHYDIMLNYIKSLPPTWLSDKESLYNNCKNGSATYVELFNELPNYTVERILRQYLNNYDNSEIKDIAASLESFQNYIDDRVDDIINVEIQNINKAMRSVFSSHYEMMVDRKYLSTNSESNWYDYSHFTNTYNLCISNKATYIDLYNLFPENDLRKSLVEVFGENIVDDYRLDKDLDALDQYLTHINHDIALINNLNTLMIKMYIENYNMYLNFDIYNKCKYNLIDYYELINYIPMETQKMILNTEIDEVTNLELYANNKVLLNSYLNSLPKEESDKIKNNITADMIVWYRDNYEDTNNYYRTLIGLPNLDNNGVRYKDTLLESYDEKSGSYIKFGNKFIDRLTELKIYPEQHWKQELCEFDNYDIAILQEYGILDDYVAACKSNMYSSRYAYIRFLGDQKLDLYTCRKASNFQLIGIPTVDNEYAKNKFIDKYSLNRDYVLRTVYSDAYEFESDYYNKFMIIFILINTIMDVLSDIPKMLIDRDVFDSRCIRYLFESFGIPYYSEIPIKYQKAMLKNLNILIKYKSSTKNMIDICNLFGFSDIRVFGYYMFKERVKDTNTGEFVFNENNDITYDLDKLYVKDVNGYEIDYNGVRYTKLLEYRDFYKEYDEIPVSTLQIPLGYSAPYLPSGELNKDTIKNKYISTVYVEKEDGSVEEKTIINNKADVYIKDEKYDMFIPLTETDYFTKIKANTNECNLKFIKVPIDDELTEYKNDPNYIVNYDEIVYGDETWDGGLQHEALKSDIKDYEFNAVRTKYISVETVTEMTELAFQVSYFYNMLFDNLYSEEALTVEIPFIKINHKFKFMDIICYLFSLMYLYNGVNDNIMYSPTQILYLKGYNFNDSINAILKDTTAFTQTKNPMDQENIFDINDRIAEDGYDYQKAFSDKDIKSFNLHVDMDELDKWLSQYQMSLDDFIVDDTLTVFNQVITLRNFYSLNNSFYQKDIFDEHLLPTQYNNDIKYAFDQKLYKRTIIEDLDSVKHEYIINDGKYIEVIDDKSDELYIIDNNKYVYIDSEKHSVYYLYYRDANNNFVLKVPTFYFYDKENNVYTTTLLGNIYIKDKYGNYVFSADEYFKKSEDGKYIKIEEDHYFYIDSNNKKVLNFGDYYIFKDGKYILDPNNCYVKVTQNGIIKYVLVKDLGDYKNNQVSDSDLYIRHSDGHFICLIDTDFYIKQEDGSYKYNKEICYVKTNDVTEYYDPSASPRQYYKKLTDYYDETNYNIHLDEQFVKNADGLYISENDLIKPDNCYYKEGDLYLPVLNNMVKFYNYTKSINSEYCIILQDTNDYERYKISHEIYAVSHMNNMIYTYSSDEDYVLLLIVNAKYADTKSMIVVFNKNVTAGSKFDDIDSKYNPELTDKIWDENDWLYLDKSYDENNSIGINGENIWYYKKPGDNRVPEEDQENPPVGSGYYLSAETYLGYTKLEKGCKYYMAFDVETNFTGQIQISCDADSECIDASTRLYDVSSGIKFHVAQVFVANQIESPRIKFLVYNFKDYPIEIGDFIIISNIRFIKAYNKEYIPQDIPSYDKLQELYRTNEAIYKFLITKMANCSDYDMYQIYKHLYDSMMVSKYNKEAFKLPDGTYAKTYTDFLRTRDSVLYERLTYFKELDIDTMKKAIADNIIEVTYAIDDCVDTYSYGYLYSYFPAVSANYIQQYISKIINFFKSWKVQLLGINTIYKLNDPLDNAVKILEDDQYRIRYNQADYSYINHKVAINPMDAYSPDGRKYSEKYDTLVNISNTEDDKVEINDRVRIIVRTANAIKYTDNVSKISLTLNDDNIKAGINVDGNLIVNSDSGLSVSLPNHLIYENDGETDESFGSQPIGEINNESMDII